jgi:glycosyltransferase involved in cell wall biosynthesis
VRVIWDGRVLCGREIRGIGNYSLELLEALRCARPSLDLRIFVDEPIPDATRTMGFPALVVGPSRGYRWQLWERVGLPWHAIRAGADLIHSPANTTPRRSPVPRVVTVHDVIPYLPSIAGKTLTDPYWTRVLPSAIRSAAAILTCSEASRQDIVRLFRIAPERITVIPYAVSERVHAPSDADDIVAATGVTTPYLLGLAATAPRKNTAGLIRVFKRVMAVHNDVSLVLTGVTSAVRPGVLSLLKDLDIAIERVHLLEFVEPRVRNALYSRAAAFLFLTLYEGFGLPILEAMRCGAPVICSNRSSCPEVAGDAAILVDPENDADVAASVSSIMTLSTSQRDQLIHRGRARADEFTWARTAHMTLAVYDRIAS